MMQLYEDGLSEREVAERFNVKRPTFASIRQGFTWNHITGMHRKTQKARGVKTRSMSER